MLDFGFVEYILIAVAYLLGSIPFGLVVAKFAGKGDIRKSGSGNIGATNVTRVIGKKLGALTLVLDAAKGVVAVLLARFFVGDENISGDVVYICAVVAVLGHCFPVWLGFKGGKGVATGFAVLTAAHSVSGLVALALWIGSFLLFRISSLSALISWALVPVLVYFIVDTEGGIGLFYMALFLSLLIVLKHHSNIKRLIKGEEGKKK